MPTDLSGAFGGAIRELRMERGMSQEQLGFRSGMHRTTVSLWERGLNTPSIETIWTLARALDVEPWELVRRAEQHLAGPARRKKPRKGRPSR